MFFKTQNVAQTIHLTMFIAHPYQCLILDHWGDTAQLFYLRDGHGVEEILGRCQYFREAAFARKWQAMAALATLLHLVEGAATARRRETASGLHWFFRRGGGGCAGSQPHRWTHICKGALMVYCIFLAHIINWLFTMIMYDHSDPLTTTWADMTQPATLNLESWWGFHPSMI